MSITTDASIIELENGIFARLHEGLTNSGIIIDKEGVIIIDSLRVPSFARDLIKDVKFLTNKPITHVIDTHAHWDHAWGNEEFTTSTIIGHINCYKEMNDIEWNTQWRKKVINSDDPWSEEAKTVKITPPNKTFEKTLEMQLSNHKIVLHYFGKAHTSGDIFIHIPEKTLLFTGDVAMNGLIPFFGDSYPKEWPETINQLLYLPTNKFMAGHGPIGSYDDLIAAKDLIQVLTSQIEKAINNNIEIDIMIKSLISLMKPNYGNWKNFENLDEGIRILHSKLKG